MKSGSPSEIAILMATYNGEKFLKAQLESFVKQTHTRWKIAVSDDGSTDGTLHILREFQMIAGSERTTLFAGPQQGYVRNFLSLICNESIIADYFAYSDQDDIWETNKLERALTALKKVPEHIPALYCSRTTFVDSQNRTLGFSAIFKKKPTFRNALVHSLSGGNTMLMNHAARALLKKVSVQINVQSHDWWSYLVISGCGGIVIYDPESSVRYRQHCGNQIGMNTTGLAKLRRFQQVLQGSFKKWNDKNINALLLMYTHLTSENQKTLNTLIRARNSGLLARLCLFLKLGIHRQTWLGNAGLLIAVILNKI